MSNNINTASINTTIYINKIKELSIQLNIANQSDVSAQTKEDLVIAANQLLDAFYRDLSGPIFNPEETIVDTKPDLLKYNTNFTNILSDLNIIFSELGNITSIILSNFNFMISDSNRLMARLKNIDSKLGNYILYSSDITRDALYTSDSFNNLNAVDFNSALINTEQCEIDQAQGIVTLPINKSSQVPIKITTKPIINDNSNGNPGNNFEKQSQLNADINVIIDNNPDTCFEYEKVIFGTDSYEPLILDITLSLGKSQPINYIRINPNNFGTKNNINILNISSSVDGKHYVSIKDDVPINGFKTVDEENVFILSSVAGKYSGQGVYSFLPRMAKYIRLTFKQTTPYNIVDVNNNKRSRYAIGIRDIEVSALPYDSTGEIISKTYTTNSGIKKVALKTNQTPIETSGLASIEHYLSTDNGLSWNRIEAINFTSTDDTVPKVLNFNTLDNDSHNTDADIKSIKYKALLIRNDDGFNNLNPISNITESVNELHQVPTNTPFDIKLNNTPSDNNIVILDPSFGSRGISNIRYKLGTGNGNQLIFNLPFNFIKKDITKINGLINYNGSEEVRVNGVLWTRGNLGTASPTNLIYELDYTNNVLKFGNDIQGKAVPQGSIVDIMFKQEQLFITDSVNPIAVLDYPTSNDKQSFTLLSYGSNIKNTEILKPATYIHKLINKHISSVHFTDTTTFAQEVLFNNGSIELLTNGQYSIDYINGVVYSKLPSISTENTRIDYVFTQVKTLEDTDWDFVFDNGFNKIIINSNSFLSIPIKHESLDSKTYISLKNTSIVRGTISFTGGNFATCYRKEVPFVDGYSELQIGINTIESVGSLDVGINTYNLKLPITQGRVSFSNTTVFSNLVTDVNDVIGTGDYYIDYDNNKIIVATGTLISDAGTISYIYDDKTKSSNGLYSVNYNTGEIYSIIAPVNVFIDYNYSHYEAQYKIARLIDQSSYTFDTDTNTVNINEREILDRANVDSLTKFYQIVFNKNVNVNDELQALKAYFSPILKDYAIRIITESNLIL